MRAYSLTMAADGSLTLPQELLRAAGQETGGVALAHVQDEQIILESVASAVARAQATARRYGDPGRSLADELIAERRAEASPH